MKKLKKSRKKPKISEKEENINKIRNIVMTEKIIYDGFMNRVKISNLIIDSIKEKLSTDVQEQDIDHFKNLLKYNYSVSIALLHECSDNLRKLKKEHYELLDKISLEENKLIKD